MKTAFYAGIVLIMILAVGYMNSQDIAACEAAGNSTEVCFATINP